MRYSPTLASIVLAGTVFIIAPYLPSAIIKPLVGTTVGAALMLILVLYVLQKDFVVSLGVALAVAALFLEYRRRIVKTVQDVIVSAKGQPDLLKKLLNPATNLIPNERHPAHETPAIEEIGETGVIQEDTIESNSKEPLESVDAHSDSIGELMREHGFASPLN